MALLKILTETDPTLRKTSKTVGTVTDRIRTLLDDMIETMRHADGVGLAAPQVGVLRRVAVIECTPGEVYELIDPVIVEKLGNQRTKEGCLSLPGKCGITDRPMKVIVEATNREGERYRVAAAGLLAKAFCHEIDHLDGILYSDIATKMLSPEEIRRMNQED